MKRGGLYIVLGLLCCVMAIILLGGVTPISLFKERMVYLEKGCPQNNVARVSSSDRLNGVMLLPQSHEAVSTSMTPVEAENTFYKYIDTLTALCEKDDRLGYIDDGGWNVCVSGAYRIKAPCIVYSFGLGNHRNFDNDVVRWWGCDVYGYDPTIGLRLDRDPPTGVKNHMVVFNRGVGGKNERTSKGWNLFTIGSLLKDNGHMDKIIDFMKMDIEYSEWAALQTAFKEGFFKNVKQFAFEFHTHEVGNGRPTTVAEFFMYYDIIRQLQQQGFRLWRSHLNDAGPYTSSRTGKHRSCCYELYFVNIHFAK